MGRGRRGSGKAYDPFSVIAAGAAARFQALRAAHRRADTMDLNIAAIALADGALLLSGNDRDFAAVAGLRFEAFRP